MQKRSTVAHNSRGVEERYHDPRRRAFFQRHEDYPTIKKDVLLAITTNEINDNLGPEGIVPSVLMFGELLFIRAFIGPKPPRATLIEREIGTQEARKLMSKHLAQMRLKRVDCHRTPRAADHEYQTIIRC